ncbi:hypothetical protein RclHR1_05940002 [Rhizophagus clarus]|nr:hypothetical protein RclHR1_05940002 [Rhizophagus clarus]
MPFLWDYLSRSYEYPLDKKRKTREKVYNVIAHFLPTSLSIHKIDLPLKPFDKPPLFEYLSFFTCISQYWVEDMKQLLIVNNEDDLYNDYKLKILEHEIFELIFNSCKKVKHFYWCTNIQLYLLDSAVPFLSNLCSIRLNLEVVTSIILLGISIFCRNLKEIEADYCDEDTSSLVTFIRVQKRLESLCLYIDNNIFLDNNIEEQNKLLSDVIKEKAENLKRITLKPDIVLILPTFIPSLTNLQYLVLNNDEGQFKEGKKWNKWEYYLSKAFFRDLRYLETLNIPNNIERLIIEKSGGKISKIILGHLLEQQDFPSYPIDNKKLIKLIYNKCQKLQSLSIDVNPINLDEIANIFTKCTQLEEIRFTTNNNVFPNGDDLLKIVSDLSPMSLREFTFGDKWNFSVKGLESFFDDWKRKNRMPITFIHYNDQWDERILWSDNHVEMVEKYRNERVIR